MKFLRYVLLTLAAAGCLAIFPEPAEAGPLGRVLRGIGRAGKVVVKAPFRVVRRVVGRRCG